MIVGLRGDAEGSADPEARHFIDQLNRDFGNLREVLQSSEPTLAEALIHPVTDRFKDTLAAVMLAYPELAAKCESLTVRLDKFLDPSPPEPTWDFGDPDIPF